MWYWRFLPGVFEVGWLGVRMCIHLLFCFQFFLQLIKFSLTIGLSNLNLL
jgi:hypothetical protein